MRLDERERPICVEKFKRSSSQPFMRTSRRFGLHLIKMMAPYVLPWIEKKLGSLHPTKNSLGLREAEMLLWSRMSQEAW